VLQNNQEVKTFKIIKKQAIMRKLVSILAVVLITATVWAQSPQKISYQAVITPNQYPKGSDSDRIEAAIANALKSGINSIEIPRYNTISKKAEWLIDRAIVIPSDFTLILKDCLLRLAPGV